MSEWKKLYTDVDSLTVLKNKDIGDKFTQFLTSKQATERAMYNATKLNWTSVPTAKKGYMRWDADAIRSLIPLFGKRYIKKCKKNTLKKQQSPSPKKQTLQKK
jgi:hypothetical protein